MPNKPQSHRPPSPKTFDHRPSASRRGYDANWRKLRLTVLAAKPVCETCGRESATEVDHYVALNAGGTNEMSNLVSLCGLCHRRKSIAHDGGFGRDRRPVERRHNQPGQ